MTNQEAFTTIVQHLRTQGGPCVGPDGICLYRHPDGIKRCAIGVLIPENEYQYSFENQPGCSIIPHVPSLKGVDIELLSFLQRKHDVNFISNRYRWLDEMEKSYKVASATFSLTIPPHPCLEQGVEQPTQEAVEVA